ncbi:MAG: GMP synthase [Acidimicrobiia bacterium]
MRLGLLLCDRVRPGFRVVSGDYPEFVARLLPDQELVVYDLVAGQFPENLGECDAWITSGSRRSVYEDIGWVLDFARLVRRLHDEERKLVGVCFGAQMIAYALGGVVGPAPNGWAVGIKTVVVPAPQPWMNPVASTFRILHSNADQITSLPPGARVLGRADDVPVSVLAVGDHILGLQGHPEFSPEYSAVLMESRRGNPIPDEVVEAGLASLVEPPDTVLLVSWIKNFILYNGALKFVSGVQ